MHHILRENMILAILALLDHVNTINNDPLPMCSLPFVTIFADKFRETSLLQHALYKELQLLAFFD